jgi:hypothetical protein
VRVCSGDKRTSSCVLNGSHMSEDLQPCDCWHLENCYSPNSGVSAIFIHSSGYSNGKHGLESHTQKSGAFATNSAAVVASIGKCWTTRIGSWIPAYAGMTAARRRMGAIGLEPPAESSQPLSDVYRARSSSSAHTGTRPVRSCLVELVAPATCTRRQQYDPCIKQRWPSTFVPQPMSDIP